MRSLLWIVLQLIAGLHLDIFIYKGEKCKRGSKTQANTFFRMMVFSTRLAREYCKCNSSLRKSEFEICFLAKNVQISQIGRIDKLMLQRREHDLEGMIMRFRVSMQQMKNKYNV